MRQYTIEFDDDRYGEFYFIADPSYISFPNDYHHPLGNLYLGLTDWQQRSRLRRPKYRDYHGCLPHHESERGFMVLLDERYRTAERDGHLRCCANHSPLDGGGEAGVHEGGGRPGDLPWD